MNEPIDCIHGLIWQSCKVCSSKTREEVLEELNKVVATPEEEGDDLVYEYQESSLSDDHDIDLDYDIDID